MYVSTHCGRLSGRRKGGRGRSEVLGKLHVVHICRLTTHTYILTLSKVSCSAVSELLLVKSLSVTISARSASGIGEGVFVGLGTSVVGNVSASGGSEGVGDGTIPGAGDPSSKSGLSNGCTAFPSCVPEPSSQPLALLPLTPSSSSELAPCSPCPQTLLFFWLELPVAPCCSLESEDLAGSLSQPWHTGPFQPAVPFSHHLGYE